MDRRTFLSTATAATALSYGRILGANDRIRIAGLGTGGRGRGLLMTAHKVGNVELAAVCDVYAPRREEAKSGINSEAREFSDFRAALDLKDVDAVIIGSPDHWHVPMTIAAVKAGKDVYVEKPVSHTVEEGEALDRLMANSDRIVQVGYQQRSWPHFIEARELIRSGKLGQITLVQSSYYQNYLKWTSNPGPLDTAKLDWKAFLGTAPNQPFDASRFRWWRWYWDFGGGHLTDLHSHYGDVLHWFMGQDQPVLAQAAGQSYALKQFECPDTITAAWQYPGFQVSYTGTIAGSLTDGNLIFRGSQASMVINREGYAVYPEPDSAFSKAALPQPSVSVKSQGDGTPAHMQNFLECVRSRKQPNSNARSAIPAARAAHLANNAYRKGVVWRSA